MSYIEVSGLTKLATIKNLPMRWRKKICIDKYVENMQTKEDFENFLVWLLEDVKKIKTVGKIKT